MSWFAITGDPENKVPADILQRSTKLVRLKNMSDEVYGFVCFCRFCLGFLEPIFLVVFLNLVENLNQRGVAFLLRGGHEITSFFAGSRCFNAYFFTSGRFQEYNRSV